MKTLLFGVTFLFVACSQQVAPQQPPTGPSPTTYTPGMADEAPPAPGAATPSADVDQAVRAAAEALREACPSMVGPIPAPPGQCKELDAFNGLAQLKGGEAGLALLDLLEGGDEVMRAIASHALNLSPGVHRTELQAATRLVTAMENEQDRNVGMVIGNAVGRIELTKLGLADRVEKSLREHANGALRIGLMNTVLLNNEARFKPVIEDLAKNEPDDSIRELAGSLLR